MNDVTRSNFSIPKRVIYFFLVVLGTALCFASTILPWLFGG